MRNFHVADLLDNIYRLYFFELRIEYIKYKYIEIENKLNVTVRVGLFCNMKYDLYMLILMSFLADDIILDDAVMTSFFKFDSVDIAA